MIVYNDPSAYFFVWCGIIFVVCTSILLLIFVPKVVRFLSKAHNRPGASRWSNSQTAGGSHTVNHAASTVTADAPREDTRAQIEDEDDVA